MIGPRIMSGRTYMHNNCKDVALEIIKVQFRSSQVTKVKAFWINLGCTGNPWMIDRTKVTIESKDVKNWIDITNKINTKRTKDGLP